MRSRQHLQIFLWELDQRDHECGAPVFVKREFQQFVRSVLLTPLAAIRDANMVLEWPLFASLLGRVPRY